jgi:hypothetical protein
MLLEVAEDAEIVVEDGGVEEVVLEVVAIDLAVFLALFGESFAGFGDFAALMDALDGLFEGDGYEEADETMVMMWMKKSRQVVAA